MKKIFSAIGLVCFIIIFLLGFIDKSPLEEIKSVADIVYSINNIPKNLDKVGQLNKREQDIICAVSKGLIEVDKNGQLIPALAESVDLRENGIEYEFKIREDVYWSDGNKITASDIEQFFKEIITLEAETDIEALMNIFGAKEYKNGNGSFKSKVAITSNNNSLIIRLNEKDDNFINELTKPQYRLRKSVLLWEDIAYNYTSIPYSGNYSISDVTELKEIVLMRNNKTDVKLAKTIHILKDESEDLALASFEVGERDIVINPPKSQLSRLAKDGKLLNIPSNKAVYLSFNKNSILNKEDRKEIYSLIIKALNEYENENKDLIKLAEGSYFREEEQDLLKLQARKVMSNSNDQIEIPEVIYLACSENVLNKEISDYLSKWFENNTQITLVTSLIRGEEITDVSYYDMALINLNADHKEKDEFYNTIAPYLNEELVNKISSINNLDVELENQIEDSIFNDYLVLPLIFYNDNIAINNIKNVELDGNGNMKFEMIKK